MGEIKRYVKNMSRHKFAECGGDVPVSVVVVRCDAGDGEMVGKIKFSLFFSMVNIIF